MEMSQKLIPTKSSGFKTELEAAAAWPVNKLKEAPRLEMTATFDLLDLNIMRDSLKVHDRFTKRLLRIFTNHDFSDLSQVSPD